MKFEQSLIRKLLITDVPRLDPVTVYLEDFRPGAGKITIECFGRSWSSSWPAMGIGGGTIVEFVIGSDNHYLTKNLYPGLSDTELDGENIQVAIRPMVIERRKMTELDKEQAAKFWAIKSLEQVEQTHGLSEELCDQLFDCERWDLKCFLPDRPNPEFVYFCRILDAVKMALSETIQAKAA